MHMNMHMHRGGVWIGSKKILPKRRHDIHDVLSGRPRPPLFRSNSCHKYSISEITFYASVAASNPSTA